MPVDKITTEDVLAVLGPFWNHRGASNASLRLRIERVLDAAKARGLRSGENPARWRGHLEQLLPRIKSSAEHYAALPFANINTFVRRLQAQDTSAARVIEFMILTAARPGEAIGARWDEVDYDRATWTIPANRMKAGREHRVPLSFRALEIIKAMREIRINDFLFPGRPPGRPITKTTVKNLLWQLEAVGSATLHGFRSSFRDWAGECTHFSNETCEAALAHTVTNQVEAAYRRGDQFEKRRQLMNAWADYCAVTEDRKVIALSR